MSIELGTGLDPKSRLAYWHRNYEIVRMYFEGSTLDQVGSEYDLHRERIRKILRKWIRLVAIHYMNYDPNSGELENTNLLILKRDSGYWLDRFDELYEKQLKVLEEDL